MKKLSIVLALLPVIADVRAEELATPADLPSTALARQLLNHDPHVMAARAAQRVANTEARLLQASSYEWSARLASQRRQYAAGGNSNEWSAELQRPIRLPGKAQIDRRIGEAGQIEAEAGIGEATHEAARALVTLWLDWLAAAERVRLRQEQQQLTVDNVAAVTKRVRSGDAARLELGLAQAELETSQRQVVEAQTLLAEARSRLQAHFPGVETGQAPPLAEPRLPDGDLAHWRERILAHSDPLRIARAQIDKAKQHAERARADRRPDPVLGIYTASEAQGDERVIGLNVTVALAGQHRALQADKAQQIVALAEQALENEQRELLANIEGGYVVATGYYSAWQAAQAAATETRRSSELTARAYALGEAELQVVLQARRQRLEADSAALDARLMALRAYYLLLVDGHYLWDLAHDD